MPDKKPQRVYRYALILKCLLVGAIMIVTLTASIHTADTSAKRDWTESEGVIFGEPAQDGIGEPETFSVGNYHFTKRAKFAFWGKVLATQVYQDKPQSDVSGMDILVAWGEGGWPRGAKLNQRWVLVDKNAYQRGEISVENFANIHLIEAGVNDKTKTTMKALDAGDIVMAEGWLVDVKGGEDGEFWWNTSLSRTDIGDGACEIFFPARITRVVSRR